MEHNPLKLHLSLLDEYKFTLLKIYIYIYLFGCAGSLVAACGNFVAACGILLTITISKV